MGFTEKTKFMLLGALVLGTGVLIGKFGLLEVEAVTEVAEVLRCRQIVIQDSAGKEKIFLGLNATGDGLIVIKNRFDQRSITMTSSKTNAQAMINLTSDNKTLSHQITDYGGAVFCINEQGMEVAYLGEGSEGAGLISLRDKKGNEFFNTLQITK